jgi:hypothetical protein
MTKPIVAGSSGSRYASKKSPCRPVHGGDLPAGDLRQGRRHEIQLDAMSERQLVAELSSFGVELAAEALDLGLQSFDLSLQSFDVCRNSAFVGRSVRGRGTSFAVRRHVQNDPSAISRSA